MTTETKHTPCPTCKDHAKKEDWVICPTCKPGNTTKQEWYKPEAGYPLLRIEERQAMGIAHWAIVDKYDQVVCRFDFLDEDDGKTRAAFIVRAVNAHEEMLQALCAAYALIEVNELHKHDGRAAIVYRDAYLAICKAEGRS